MSAVVMLALKSRRWTIHLAVAAWLLLLIVGVFLLICITGAHAKTWQGSQIAYAAIPLCFSVEKTQNMALLRPGNVAIPNMESIQTTKVIVSSVSSVKAQQFTANRYCPTPQLQERRSRQDTYRCLLVLDSYGIISLAYVQGNVTDMPEPGTLWYSDDELIFCDENNTWCSYIFLETNPSSLRNPNAIPVTATTNRAVFTSSRCSSFPVIQHRNSTEDTLVIDRGESTLEIPVPVRGALDQSIFMTNTSSYSHCGPDCGIVSIFESSPSSSWYYNCTTKLSPVSNAALTEHNLGLNLTRLATTAIALRGFSTRNEENDEIQFQIYPSASIHGVPLNGSAENMGFLLSRFAIGVVAITAEANTDLHVAGWTPHIGQKLTVQHWYILHLVFGLTVGLQLIFAVAATWTSRRVVTPAGGSVAEAQVLRSMMAHETDASLKIMGSEKCDEKGFSRLKMGKRDRWIYRHHYVGDGIYDLFMERVTPTMEDNWHSSTHE